MTRTRGSAGLHPCQVQWVTSLHIRTMSAGKFSGCKSPFGLVPSSCRSLWCCAGFCPPCKQPTLRMEKPRDLLCTRAPGIFEDTHCCCSTGSPAFCTSSRSPRLALDHHSACRNQLALHPSGASHTCTSMSGQPMKGWWTHC